jgi:hypothetical protein
MGPPDPPPPWPPSPPAPRPAGSSKEEVAGSPFVEALVAKGYEVLYMTDPLDEYVMQVGHEQQHGKEQTSRTGSRTFGGSRAWGRADRELGQGTSTAGAGLQRAPSWLLAAGRPAPLSPAFPHTFRMRCCLRRRVLVLPPVPTRTACTAERARVRGQGVCKRVQGGPEAGGQG